MLIQVSALNALLGNTIAPTGTFSKFLHELQQLSIQSPRWLCLKGDTEFQLLFNIESFLWEQPEQEKRQYDTDLLAALSLTGDIFLKQQKPFPTNITEQQLRQNHLASTTLWHFNASYSVVLLQSEQQTDLGDHQLKRLTALIEQLLHPLNALSPAYLSFLLHMCCYNLPACELLLQSYPTTVFDLFDTLISGSEMTEDQFITIASKRYHQQIFAYEHVDKLELPSLVKPSYLAEAGILLIKHQNKGDSLLTCCPFNQINLNMTCNILAIPKDNIFICSPAKFLIYSNSGSQRKIDIKGLDESLNQQVESSVQQSLDLDEKGVYSSDSLTITTLVDELLERAAQQSASDIHLAYRNRREATVVFRIDGTCQTITSFSHVCCVSMVARIKILAELNIAERRLPQDGKFQRQVANRTFTFRVVSIPTVFGENIVIRVLANNRIMTLSELALPSFIVSQLKEISRRKHGLVLVSGPTGSGKTTTLHAMLEHINDGSKTIWTAEDPVELMQDGLNQLQIRENVGLTFDQAVKAFLRADPDVMLIGEIRDLSTAKAATQAALTGHLVFSTLHTNSIVETIRRLSNLGLESYNIADACCGIMAQRLLPRLCQSCKQKQPLTANDKQRLSTWLMRNRLVENTQITEYYWKTTGCAHCQNSGYRGRVGVFEFSTLSETFKQLINANSDSAVLYDYLDQQKLKRIVHYALEHFIAGDIYLEELLSIS